MLLPSFKTAVKSAPFPGRLLEGKPRLRYRFSYSITFLFPHQSFIFYRNFVEVHEKGSAGLRTTGHTRPVRVTKISPSIFGDGCIFTPKIINKFFNGLLTNFISFIKIKHLAGFVGMVQAAGNPSQTYRKRLLNRCGYRRGVLTGRPVMPSQNIAICCQFLWIERSLLAMLH